MSENIPTINPDQAEAMHRQAKIDGTMLRECALNSLVPVVPGLKHDPHVALALTHALAQHSFAIVKDRGMDPMDLEVGANYILKVFGHFLSELYREQFGCSQATVSLIKSGKIWREGVNNGA